MVEFVGGGGGAVDGAADLFEGEVLDGAKDDDFAELGGQGLECAFEAFVAFAAVGGGGCGLGRELVQNGAAEGLVPRTLAGGVVGCLRADLVERADVEVVIEGTGVPGLEVEQVIEGVAEHAVEDVLGVEALAELRAETTADGEQQAVAVAKIQVIPCALVAGLNPADELAG